ncbi:MAG TPA: cytosine permease [Acidimicrobiales bacterium]|nr:cytosine permease [Acidimicrobiales bacterium]
MTTSPPAATVPPPEVPATLEEPAPRPLGFADQVALWGNLGVSLLLVVAGTFVLRPDPTLPPLSLVAAFAAILTGAILGNLLLGLVAMAGSEIGAPAMVSVRGLLGRRGSTVPTVANIAQNLGWAVIELVVIAGAAAQLLDDAVREVVVVAGGLVATAMALRPLGVVRGYLKRVAVWAVIASSAYLLVQVARGPLPAWGDGSWSGFWKATDTVVALPISWLPLAADYSRHSRSHRAAFAGAGLGYGAATLAFFALGVLATASGEAGDDVIASLLAIPAGTVALLILAIDELDEVFANVYSTTVSAQNLAPRLDRRVGVVVTGALATALALAIDDYVAYESFLFLLGSVFVPLFGSYAVDYFAFRRGRWEVGESAPTRWAMFVPWAAGFVTYQLVNPGFVSWWAPRWMDVREAIGFTPPSWASASILSFAVAAAVTALFGVLSRPAASSRGRATPEPSRR